jgi:hypothetical protein
MVLPPLLDFRLNPAFVLDSILKLEVNGNMTGRLQIGNVARRAIRPIVNECGCIRIGKERIWGAWQ